MKPLYIVIGTFVASCLLQHSIVASRTIFIPSNGDNRLLQLQDYLCGVPPAVELGADMILELDTEVVHSIPDAAQFCLVRNLNNLTIRSSDPQSVATIHCSGGNPLNQTGFGFFNIRGLVLSNIRIDNCGGIVSREVARIPTLGLDQQAVLTVSSCFDVLIENLHISNYAGYGLFGLNLLGDCLIDTISVKDSYSHRINLTNIRGNSSFMSGGGITLVSHNSMSPVPIPTSITLSNVEVTRSRNIYPQYFLKTLISLLLLNGESDSILFPLGGMGAITVVFSSISHHVNFTLSNANVTNNQGSIGGGVTMLHVFSNLRSNVLLKQCTIDSNKNMATSGSGLQLHYLFLPSFLLSLPMTQNAPPHATIVLDSTIKNHFNTDSGAGVDIVMQPQNIADIEVSFVDTFFVNNSALVLGDTISARSDYSILFTSRELRLYLHSVRLYGPKIAVSDFISTEEVLSSSISLFGLGGVYITGSEEAQSVFFGHQRSVIRAIDTDVFLNGSVKFLNNRAQKGAALLLTDNSHLFFVHPSQVLFENNTALQAGGAIFSSSLSGPQCGIQFITPSFTQQTRAQTVFSPEDLQTLNFSISFVGNTAPTGNSIFSAALYNCTVYSESITQISSDSIFLVYQSLFTFGGSATFLEQLRSRAFRPCICQRNTSQCDNNSTNNLQVQILSGVSFSLHVLLVDVLSQPVEAILSARIKVGNDLVRFRNPTEQSATLTSRECSEVTYTLVLAGIENETSVLMELGIVNSNKVITVGVVIPKCPFGFVLDEVSKECVCAPLFQQTAQECNTSSGLISREEGEWIGQTLSNSNIVPAYSRVCLTGYCTSSLVRTYVNLSIPNSICIPNREGEMCGRCKPGYSVVFGTNRCLRCSNFWLFTLLLYMLLGILLVVVIDKLELTVTNGTINGIIFYAQMTSITNSLFNEFNDNEVNLSFITRFISFFNLEIGIPISLCFYDGMDQVAKMALQFVFPVYLWVLVLVIIVIRRFKIAALKKFRWPQSVNILVTLIYLSYGKLLTTVAILFLPNFVEVKANGASSIEYRTVWLLDGTVIYFKGLHLFFCIMGLVFFLLFILPYKVIILLSQWCLRVRCLAYYIPVVDANLAPFKNKLRYWFGLKLIFTGVLIFQSIILSPYFPLMVLYINTMALSLFTVLQGYCRPYKSTALNLLDLFFLMNVILLYISQLYAAGATGNDMFQLVPFRRFSKILEFTSSLAAILVFVGILIYHIIKVVRKCRMKCLQKREQKRNHSNEEDDEVEGEAIEVGGASLALPSNYFDDYNHGDGENIELEAIQRGSTGYSRYRESILDTTFHLQV